MNEARSEAERRRAFAARAGVAPAPRVTRVCPICREPEASARHAAKCGERVLVHGRWRTEREPMPEAVPVDPILAGAVAKRVREWHAARRAAKIASRPACDNWRPPRAPKAQKAES